MLLAAQFGTGQVLWSMLWFFLFVVWIMLVFQTIGDIFRSDDLSGLSKAIWTLLIVFMPYLGVFIYLIVRGEKMSQRQIASLDAQEAAVQNYIRSAAAASGTADQLKSLADLHTAGKLSDKEYTAAKSGIIGS
jgi:hypothetical protein